MHTYGFFVCTCTLAGPGEGQPTTRLGKGRNDGNDSDDGDDGDDG